MVRASLDAAGHLAPRVLVRLPMAPRGSSRAADRHATRHQVRPVRQTRERDHQVRDRNRPVRGRDRQVRLADRVRRDHLGHPDHLVRPGRPDYRVRPARMTAGRTRRRPGSGPGRTRACTQRSSAKSTGDGYPPINCLNSIGFTCLVVNTSRPPTPATPDSLAMGQL